MKTFKFRLYPTSAQITAMNAMIEAHRAVYNSALNERKLVYETTKKSVGYVQQARWLKGARERNEDIAKTNYSSLQATLRRLDKSYQAFFRRVKAGEKAGFPRFKRKGQFKTIEYPAYGDGCKIKGLSCYFQFVGNIKTVFHRPLQGKIKTMSFTHRAGKWFVMIVCETDKNILPVMGQQIGVDVGLTSFATLSTGEKIDNPRFFRKDESALAKSQHKLSAQPKGSLAGNKARKVVSRIHERIANRRSNFAHQLSRKLVNQYDVIALEDLSIPNMMANHCLAKSIADAAWNQFMNYTAYKAENAGRLVVKVDPRNTSQRCSACGEIVKKELRERVHACSCGCVLDRDHNAALNILTLGQQSYRLWPKEAAAL
jgi:putative transposase